MPKKPKKLLFDIADSQLGYFTHQQAESCGIPSSHFHRFLKSGEWIKEQRGIYKLSHYPVQDRSELVLWSLWSRNKEGIPLGVWSHETALDFFDLTDVMPPKMHLTVPKSFRRSQKIPDILILHREDLDEKDVEVLRRYRITKPLKTLIDIERSHRISYEQIKLGIQQAIDKGLISKREIQRREDANILTKYLNEI